MRRSRSANPVLVAARRAVVALIGVTLLLVGIVLIFTPGPAIVVVGLALAILAAEFAWARRWLRRLRATTNSVLFSESSQQDGPDPPAHGLHRLWARRQDMAHKRSTGHSATPRPSRRIHEAGPDKQGKLPELARCPGCDASYRQGRWTWKKAPADAYEHTCPACERIETDYPAGVVHVGGGFVPAHRDELVALLRNVEERERQEHPLKRIMAIDDEPSGFRVTLTDAKLADAMGRALEHAYAGRLQHPPTGGDKDDLIRVHWSRD